MGNFLETEEVIMKKSINVGASSYTGNYLMPTILADWEKVSPDTELKLEITDTEEVFEQVESGVLQLGLVGACLESDNVEAEEFLQNDELILIAPPSHPLAQKKEISVEELRGQDFILREPGSATRMWYRENLNRYCITFDDLNVVAEMAGHPSVIKAVEAGSGLSMVPKKAALDSLELGRVKEVKVTELSPMTGSLYMLHPRGDSLTPESRQFLDFLEAERPKFAQGQLPS
jgi:DNA-binding transcriptional LysR family regulator